MVEQEYAKALFELAQESNKLELYIDYFTAIVETVKKDFYKLLTSPSIEKNEKKEVIKKVYHTFDEDFLHFLFVLIDNNRISRIGTIFDEFMNFVLMDKNIVQVEVHSAVELNDKQIKHFENKLKERYNNKKLEIKNIVNPDLLGGIRIIANNEELDMSAKNHLNKIKETL